MPKYVEMWDQQISELKVCWTSNSVAILYSDLQACDQLFTCRLHKIMCLQNEYCLLYQGESHNEGLSIVLHLGCV